MTAVVSPAVRGRLAPSPTGRLHLGNAYAFLAAWLRVRSQNGTLLLRMEDIDPERSRGKFAAGICEDLSWLGITWDEGPDKDGPYGPYAQSQRLDRYALLLEELGRRNLVYPCYCTRKELRTLASAPHAGDEGAPYPGVCRSLSPERRAAYERGGRRPALRLDVGAALGQLASGAFRPPLAADASPAPCPGRAARRPELTRSGHAPEPSPAGGADDESSPVAFNDAVLGPQRASPADRGGDFALRRSDGVVAYQLAVAADDAAMGVTEVVRGDDLLPSTPRQILLFRLMGVPPPSYAHLPLVHDASGERLAKRHASLQIAALREQGLRPEAVVGYLGWLAGWLDAPRAVGPAGLLSGFSLASLAGRRLRLPGDPLREMAAL